MNDPNDLKMALRKHILLPVNRFSKPSRDMRLLVKTLCMYSSSKSISVLEGIWREVITDWVLEECYMMTEPHSWQLSGVYYVIKLIFSKML